MLMNESLFSVIHNSFLSIQSVGNAQETKKEEEVEVMDFEFRGVDLDFVQIEWLMFYFIAEGKSFSFYDCV